MDTHRQAFAVTIALAVATVAVWALAARSEGRLIRAGFWFDAVTFDASEVQAARLGGGITPGEMARIQSVARSEIDGAFAGLRIGFSAARDAPYRVRVVQQLRDVRFPRAIGPMGESRGVFGIGGQGAVSFQLIASYAIAYAPPGADRAAVIDGIGRGVGRAAVHEFAHLLLGSRDIHHTKDRMSYEAGNGDRAAQFYGPMRWDVAWPMLVERLGPP